MIDFFHAGTSRVGFTRETLDDSDEGMFFGVPEPAACRGTDLSGICGSRAAPMSLPLRKVVGQFWISRVPLTTRLVVPVLKDDE
jgi:hypothetical protein